MKIGMIGAGQVSIAVARYAVAAGHQVVLSNRSPDKLAKAVTDLGAGASGGTVREAFDADMVLLAVHWPDVPGALAGLPNWNGKILIDATNPFLTPGPNRKFADTGDKSASEIVAALAPGARLVKAFNSVTMANFAAGPRRGDARRVLFVSGDDQPSKDEVIALIKSFGFAVFDLGGLATGGRLQQAGGPLATVRDLLLASSS